MWHALQYITFCLKWKPQKLLCRHFQVMQFTILEEDLHKEMFILNKHVVISEAIGMS